MLVALVFLLLTTSAAGQNRLQFDVDLPCYIKPEDRGTTLEFVDRVSTLWERGEANGLSSMLIPLGWVSAPDRTFKGPSEVEKAVSAPLARPLFQGSRLEIIVQCFRYNDDNARQASTRGIWTISRFYGQEQEAPGNPLPSHLMPPTAGSFNASLVKLEAGWKVAGITLKFSEPD